MLDERVQARLHPGRAHRPHGVPEVALGLAQIVRLGEALARERAVGDLGLAALRERVVDGLALRRPGDERARRGARGARESARAAQLSPLGSTTIAPSPRAIAFTAISDCVTVLPEPVAPTTSTCRPWRSPSGTVTVRPRSSRPIARAARAAGSVATMRPGCVRRGGVGVAGARRAVAARRTRAAPGRRPPRDRGGARRPSAPARPAAGSCERTRASPRAARAARRRPSSSAGAADAWP